ncbi:hypothetical protein OCHUTO_0181 [Orientia chuto str. Dubai]|uniref:Uncharacterized protein n=1 Tax=Orientia chuto str. Dubai TaxID=1359168 RepID=A0A0F3MRH0_9RICK|nr:hypothetical protein OCHUTO_0181 [Orientia chuto str. Dubai]
MHLPTWYYLAVLINQAINIVLILQKLCTYIYNYANMPILNA